jgi:hypothetical protein
MTERAQEPVGNEIVPGRPHDDLVEDEIYEYEADDGGDEYEEDGADNMPAQRFEVVDEAHLRAVVVHSAQALEKAFPVRRSIAQRLCF